jgi:ribonuclease P/MRP protein subunit POP7
VKRVQKNLAAIEARSAGPINLHHPSKNMLQQIHDGAKAARSGKKDGGAEEVILKGTGKAIEKVVALAAWFQDGAQSELGVRVVVRTGSVGAIDDVVPRDEEQGADEGEDGVGEGDETRIRRVSCLEVGISLR